MGAPEIWRGIPNCWIRSTALYTDVPVASGCVLDNDKSNGTTTVCETKLKIDSKSNLPQLIKTCKVSSFIEVNLYPGQNTMVPTMLMDTERAVIVLYIMC